MLRPRPAGLLLIVVLASGACSSSSQYAPVAPVAAQLSLERFLQAANDRDFQSMGRLFGTRDGSVMETGSTFKCAFKKIGSWFGGSACTKRTEVEIRMDAIASIIRHEDYRIVREEMVAGRTTPTRRLIVDLTIDGEAVTAVPFVVVQTHEGRWLVEQVPLERIMAAR
ncbi:MAG: hypothetical protein PVJ80_06710 [Gemmatimonadota bacterium]